MRAFPPKVAALIIGLGLLSAAACSIGPHTKQEPFDSRHWQAAPLYGTDETRLHMLEDVEKRIQKMKPSDVEALLGPQSDPSYFKGWDLRYWLGPNDLDSWWLLVRFRNGVVSEIRVSSD